MLNIYEEGIIINSNITIWFYETKAGTKSRLLYVYLVTKPLYWSKDEASEEAYEANEARC